jgi:hypothetical protein
VRLFEFEWIPNFAELPDQEFDWTNNVYGHVKEVLPKEFLKPLGKSVTTITYKDVNLSHDMMTGRSVSGILVTKEKYK